MESDSLWMSDGVCRWFNCGVTCATREAFVSHLSSAHHSRPEVMQHLRAQTGVVTKLRQFLCDEERRLSAMSSHLRSLTEEVKVISPVPLTTPAAPSLQPSIPVHQPTSDEATTYSIATETESSGIRNDSDTPPSSASSLQMTSVTVVVVKTEPQCDASLDHHDSVVAANSLSIMPDSLVTVKRERDNADLVRVELLRLPLPVCSSEDERVVSSCPLPPDATVLFDTAIKQELILPATATSSYTSPQANFTSVSSSNSSTSFQINSETMLSEYLPVVSPVPSPQQPICHISRVVSLSKQFYPSRLSTVNAAMNLSSACRNSKVCQVELNAISVVENPVNSKTDSSGINQSSDRRSSNEFTGVISASSAAMAAGGQALQHSSQPSLLPVGVQAQSDESDTDDHCGDGEQVDTPEDVATNVGDEDIEPPSLPSVPASSATAVPPTSQSSFINATIIFPIHLDNREFFRNFPDPPPCSLRLLVRQSIVESKRNKLTARKIRKWIQTNFIYYRQPRFTNWNDVRQVLRRDSCFVRNPPSDVRRSALYCVDDRLQSSESAADESAHPVPTGSVAVAEQKSPSPNNITAHRRGVNSVTRDRLKALTDDLQCNAECYLVTNMKSPFSLASLVEYAIYTSVNGQLTLDEICAWLSDTFTCHSSQPLDTRIQVIETLHTPMFSPVVAESGGGGGGGDRWTLTYDQLDTKQSGEADDGKTDVNEESVVLSRMDEGANVRKRIRQMPVSTSRRTRADHAKMLGLRVISTKSKKRNRKDKLKKKGGKKEKKLGGESVDAVQVGVDMAPDSRTKHPKKRKWSSDGSILKVINDNNQVVRPKSKRRRCSSSSSSPQIICEVKKESKKLARSEVLTNKSRRSLAVETRTSAHNQLPADNLEQVALTSGSLVAALVEEAGQLPTWILATFLRHWDDGYEVREVYGDIQHRLAKGHVLPLPFWTSELGLSNVQPSWP